MTEDIVDILLASKSDLHREAAAEIKALRRVIHGRDEAAIAATKLMTDWAYRSGYQEGGMFMIRHGHADPVKVAKQCLERFVDSCGSTQENSAKPRKRSRK